jgi:hypothetical protein
VLSAWAPVHLLGTETVVVHVRWLPAAVRRLKPDVFSASALPAQERALPARRELDRTRSGDDLHGAEYTEVHWCAAGMVGVTTAARPR